MATWQPLPALRPATAAKSARPNRDWEDAAGDAHWQEAVILYLRDRRREAVPYWTVINAVVLASVPPDRWELRYNTRQVLTAVKTLIKERRVMRFRRNFLVTLDTGEIIPLERYRALPCRTATGRRAADSTLAR
jgi:hypothetical protein